MQVSKKLDGIKMSGIRKMFELASDEAIHLGLGEPDFQPPKHVIDALIKAVKDGHNKYASSFGIKPLREAIAEDLSIYAPLTFENVMVTASGTEALFVTLNTLLDPGDEVLSPDPGFVLYDSQIKLAGGTPVNYCLDQENEYLPVIEELEEKVGRNTKAIIINSPSNPTGSMLSDAQWRELAEWAEEHDVLIISDEVYDKIIYNDTHKCALEYLDNTVVINSFSKTLAMTGWRLGYLVTPDKDLLQKLSVSHYYTIACPPTPTQFAALAAYGEGDATKEYLDHMVTTFRRRRDKIVALLNDIPAFETLHPPGAFYAYPSYDTEALDLSAEDLAVEIARNNVICSPGTAFGKNGEGHLRFSFAASDESITLGVAIVAEVIEKMTDGTG